MAHGNASIPTHTPAAPHRSPRWAEPPLAAGLPERPPQIPVLLQRGAPMAVRWNAPKVGHIVKLLNDSLATELVCVLRYKRNQFMALASGWPEMAEEFMRHANEEMAHAELLAGRIVALGGVPDFSPLALAQNGHVGFDEARDLCAMTCCNLMAEHTAVETYAQIIELLRGTDPVTQHLLEDIVLDELDHAHSLHHWFDQLSATPVAASPGHLRTAPPA